MTFELAAVLTAAVAGLGVVIDSAELLTRRPVFEQAFSGPVLVTQYPLFVRHRGVRRAFTGVTSGRPLATALLVRAAAAVVAAPSIAMGSRWAAAACLIVTVVSALLRMRMVYGLDGSDQMQAIIWAALTVYAIAPGSLTSQLAIGFVAAQLALCYVTSGAAKLVSTEWRSGRAITGILSTEAYGHPGLHRLVSVPAVALLVCWSVIAFELGFPLLAVLGGPALLAAAGMAVLFHAGVAYAMGLNGFTWAFVGALPCVAAVVEVLGA